MLFLALAGHIYNATARQVVIFFHYEGKLEKWAAIFLTIIAANGKRIELAKDGISMANKKAPVFVPCKIGFFSSSCVKDILASIVIKDKSNYPQEIPILYKKELINNINKAFAQDPYKTDMDIMIETTVGPAIKATIMEETEEEDD